MANKANLAWQLNGMSPGRAVSSTRIDVLYETSDGVVLAVADVTAISQLSALRVTLGMEFAPGCIIIPVNSVACTVASCRIWQNKSDDVTPVITQVATAV